MRVGAAQANHWRSGLLCEECYAFYSVAVPVALAVGGCAVLLLVWQRLKSAKAHRRRPDNTISIVITFLQVGVRAFRFSLRERALFSRNTRAQFSATIRFSSQINAAQSATSQNTAGTVGLNWLDQLLSMRPWAAECIVDAWSDTTATIWLLAAPWIVVAVAAVFHGLRAPVFVRRREAAVTVAAIFLDLLYVPTSQRASMSAARRSCGDGHALTAQLIS